MSLPTRAFGDFVAMKIISLYAARADQDRVQFRRWFLEEHAEAVVDHCPHIERYVVNLVDVEPNFESTLGKARRWNDNSFDVVEEMWVPDIQAFCDPLTRYDSAASAESLEGDITVRLRRRCSYLVDEAYQQLRPAVATDIGQRSPGVKQIALCLWNLTEETAREFWRGHAARALPFHIGMGKYTQNWIVRMLTPYALPLHGIGELYWPTHDDLERRYLDSKEGAELVYRDQLVSQDYTALYSSEYRLKGSPTSSGVEANFLSYTGGYRH